MKHQTNPHDMIQESFEKAIIHWSKRYRRHEWWNSDIDSRQYPHKSVVMKESELPQVNRRVDLRLVLGEREYRGSESAGYTTVVPEPSEILLEVKARYADLKNHFHGQLRDYRRYADHRDTDVHIALLVDGMQISRGDTVDWIQALRQVDCDIVIRDGGSKFRWLRLDSEKHPAVQFGLSKHFEVESEVPL